MSGGRRVQPLRSGIITVMRHTVREGDLAVLVRRPPVSLLPFTVVCFLSALLLLAVGKWREIPLTASHDSLPFLLFNASKRTKINLSNVSGAKQL